MTVNLSRAIAMGFATAKQSVQSMAIFMIGSLIAVLLVGGLFALTFPPIQEIKKAYDEQQRQQQQAMTQARRNPGAVNSQVAAPDASGQTSQASAPSKKPDPFVHNPVVRSWFFRSWPILALMLLSSIILFGYLFSWQMNYLAHKSSGREFVLHDSCKEAAVLLWEYCKASLVGFGFICAAFMIGGLSFLFLGLLPKVLAGLLAFLLVMAGIIFMIWISVRLSFWYSALACDKEGVMAGLKSSFYATKGKVLPLAGFYIVLGLIRLGVNIVTKILGLIIGALGALIHAPAFILFGLTMLTAWLLDVCIQFFTNGSMFHYYLGLRSEPMVGEITTSSQV